MIKKNGTQKPRKSQNNAGPLSFREFGEFCVRFEEKSHRNATDGHGLSLSESMYGGAERACLANEVGKGKYFNAIRRTF